MRVCTNARTPTLAALMHLLDQGLTLRQTGTHICTQTITHSAHISILFYLHSAMPKHRRTMALAQMCADRWLLHMCRNECLCDGWTYVRVCSHTLMDKRTQVHEHTHACKSTHALAHAKARMHSRRRTHVCAQMYAHMCTGTCTQAWAQAHVRVHAGAHTRTCACICACVHMPTHMCTRQNASLIPCTHTTLMNA